MYTVADIPSLTLDSNLKRIWCKKAEATKKKKASPSKDINYFLANFGRVVTKSGTFPRQGKLTKAASDEKFESDGRSGRKESEECLGAKQTAENPIVQICFRGEPSIHKLASSSKTAEGEEGRRQDDNANYFCKQICTIVFTTKFPWD